MEQVIFNVIYVCDAYRGVGGRQTRQQKAMANLDFGPICQLFIGRQNFILFILLELEDVKAIAFHFG